MALNTLYKTLKATFGENVCRLSTDGKLEILQTNVWINVARFLQQNPECGHYDHLANLTAIDLGSSIELNYSLYSYIHQRALCVSLQTTTGQNIASVSAIWASANWHEREVYDLFGVVFDQHPDLRRILLPADWEGFPLLKTYQPAETYHGIPIAFEKPQEDTQLPRN